MTAAPSALPAPYPTPYVVQRHAYRDGSSYDAHGNPVRGWDEPTDVAVYGWAAPTSTEPKLAGQDRVAIVLELFAPPGTAAQPADRFTVDGELYDVVGEVEDYTHGPFGWRPGVVINLARWEG